MPLKLSPGVHVKVWTSLLLLLLLLLLVHFFFAVFVCVITFTATRAYVIKMIMIIISS